MKKTIKINNNMTFINLICFFFIGLIIIFITYSFTKELFFLLFWLVVLIIGSFFSYRIDIKEQAIAVTKIIINENKIILVYKNKTTKTISKDSIKSFNVLLNSSENLSYYKFFTTSIEGNVNIELLNGSSINFEIYKQVSVGNYNCNYNLILYTIQNAKAIPNFSYEISGNSQLIKEDIEYYKVHKKHLPRKYVYKYELKNASFQRKFALIILPILCILGFLSLIFAIIIKIK